MSEAPVQPSQLLCPRAPDGGTHHLVPTRHGSEQVMACAYCKKSEQTLRALGRLPSQEDDQQRPEQPGQPDQAHPDGSDQDQPGEHDGMPEAFHFPPPAGSQPLPPEVEGS